MIAGDLVEPSGGGARFVLIDLDGTLLPVLGVLSLFHGVVDAGWISAWHVTMSARRSWVRLQTVAAHAVGTPPERELSTMA